MATNESRHAEIAALSKIHPDKRKGVTVVSVRVRRTATLACGKPCPRCEAFMRWYQVKKVYYSDSRGRLVCLKL